MPSTVIKEFSYDAEAKRLLIVFTTGKLYAYNDVPAIVYEDMKRAFSKGEFFNQHIRDNYEFEKLPKVSK